MLRGKPDLRTPSGVGIWWQGQTPHPDAVAMVERVHRAALWVCPAEREAELRDLWPAIEVAWMPDPFDCGGRHVHGCAWSETSIQVASVAALPDELGHAVWWVCFGRPSEHTSADGRIVYDPDFAAWVGALR